MAPAALTLQGGTLTLQGTLNGPTTLSGGTINGTGQITGDKYQGTDSETLRATLGAATTFTLTNSFQVVGPGPDNNFTVHLTSHFTVNANGEITSDHFSSSVECS